MEIPVLLPKVFNNTFTYLNNSKKIKNLSQGDLVVVPFGRSKELGVVWDKINSTKKKIKLKQIEKKISNIKLDKKLIKFINWFSTYNLVPKGMVLKMCLGNLKNFDKANKKKLLLKSKTSNYKLNDEQTRSLNNLINFGSKFKVSVLLGVT